VAQSLTNALIFTAYMVPVGLIDNVLRPFLMARGLATPMPVIVIGVIGGTIALGIVGLFFGPIVLSVAWVVLAAWLQGKRCRRGGNRFPARAEPTWLKPAYS
jgi:predicted PurR-regulated permease PerM